MNIRTTIISILLFTLTGCSSYMTRDNGITTLSCNTGYVKHLKYDENEVSKFKKKRHKTAFLTGNIEDIGKCDTYPCVTCKLFMCKKTEYKSVKYYDKKDGVIFEAKSSQVSKDNLNYVKHFSKTKITGKIKADYIWNVYSKDGLEYEQVYNKKNGYLVYEMITPEKLETETYVNECDVNAYSIFNEFYMQW